MTRNFFWLNFTFHMSRFVRQHCKCSFYHNKLKCFCCRTLKTLNLIWSKKLWLVQKQGFYLPYHINCVQRYNIFALFQFSFFFPLLIQLEFFMIYTALKAETVNSYIVFNLYKRVIEG